MLPSLFRPLSLGRLFGIPILITPLMVVLTLLLLAQVAGRNGPVAAGELLLLFVILGFSLVVHELAHALVGRRLGLRVLDITIWPLGGMARLEGAMHQPQIEGPVAAAGPLANLVLAGAFFLIPGPIGESGFWINLVLALGNLIPAFPLDGGRVLRSWLARNSPFADATRAAVGLSNLFLLAFLAMAIRFEFIFLGLILAGYLAWTGRMELLQSVLRSGRLPTLKPLEVWKRAFRQSSIEPDVSPPSQEEASSESEENPPPEVNADLENYRGSLEDYFRQKRKWQSR